MTDAPKTFAEWMRSGAALNVPGAPLPPTADGRDLTGFHLPPDDGVDGEERFFSMSEHCKGGVDGRRLRDIARGKALVEDELDLHGCTAAEAHERLEEFLRRALSGGLRVVEIVHGRGLGADDGRGVLKAKTRKWLAQCDAALAFVEPRQNPGAVRALLRKNYGAPKPGTGGTGGTGGRGKRGG